MARAYQRPAALYYPLRLSGRNGGSEHSAAVENTYIELAEMPGMGAPAKVPNGRHAGVRLWRVRDFENYLIAYRERRAGGVSIERLFHAKQDHTRLLG